jgi:hypothetical protein
MWKISSLFLALAVLGAAAFQVVPEGARSLALRLAADDPARLAELQLARFDVGTAAREIETALAEDDLELADSFVALAEARAVELPADLVGRIAAARWSREQWLESARRFGRGFAKGDPDGFAGIAGATTGDLLLYGDFRDLAREGMNWARGDEVDRVMIGLASVGLAVTAGTFYARGAAAPTRIGVSVFKAARRTGRVGVRLADDMARVARSGRPAQSLVAFTDLAGVQQKAGARTALEGLRHADSVADVSRLRRLAETNGRATLAILKTLGRGAIVLGAGAVTAALWVMGAATNIFLLVLTLCTIFAVFARWLWRGGRLAWRGGRYAAVKMTA